MFWLSYECFSILCDTFFLTSVISSHNNCAHLPDTGKEIFHMSLLKTVLPFLTSQAVQFCSHGIADFIFSHEFHVAIP